MFRHSGAPEADARPAAEVLVTSDRRGIDSRVNPLVRAVVEDLRDISKQIGIPFD
jgi:LDH2 family malate/lactate/ureidoglycolate dehydrogenase